MTSRHDLERALRRSGGSPAPGPDPEFVDLLERRLSMARSTVGARERPRRRMGVATVAAVALGLGGAAATAAVVVHEATTSEAPPADSPTSVPTTTDGPSTTVAVSTGSTEPTPTAEATVPGAGGPATTASDATTSDRPATSAATSVPATNSSEPPSSTSSTTTTEVHTPATMTLSCTTDGSVHCSWTPGPSGLSRYAVLRGEPDNPSAKGRAFFVAAGTTSWTDPSAVPGTNYTYVVHAFDADDKSLGHTTLVAVTCC